MMDPVEPAPEPVLETEEVETEEMMRHRVEQEERARMEEGLEELDPPEAGSSPPVSLKEVATRFGLLGMIAFGGPPAHVALMHAQTWRPGLLDDAGFASLFALTQCLPGPSSTQLAIALGILMAGPKGGLVAFGCFSMTATTSMTILGSIAYLSKGKSLGALDPIVSAIQMGLAAGAVALVVKAAMALSEKLATDPVTKGLNVAAASLALLLPGHIWVLPTTLVLAGCFTTAEAEYVARRDGAPGKESDDASTHTPGSLLAGDQGAAEVPQTLNRRLAHILGGAWLGLLLLLLVWTSVGAPLSVQLLEVFYRTGSLVWGGGPVVLPLLLREVVPKFVTHDQFLQGFAYVQAMPGPMFNFSAFLGGAYMGPVGSLLAWTGLFLPGLLLVYAALPYWAMLRGSARAKTALRGVNAAASGLVVAAAVMLFHAVSKPPQQSITLICIAVHHFVGPKLFGPKLNPPLTIALGAFLGAVLCIPWVD